MNTTTTGTPALASGRVLKALLRPRRIVPRLAPGRGIVAASPGVVVPGNFVDLGGLILTNVHIWLIFWGTTWGDGASPSMSDVTQAISAILDGPYMRGLHQYRGIAGGLLGGTVRVFGSNPPNPFSDSDVANMIYAELEKGTMPEPDDDPLILYCVILPPGTDSTRPNVIGEHSYFTYFDLADLQLPPDFDLGNAHYAWVTNDGTLDGITTIFSHELAESCTDPNGDGIQGTPGTCSQEGWCEIGDVCTSWTDVRDGVRVQAYWSQADRACILPEESTKRQQAPSLGEVSSAPLPSTLPASSAAPYPAVLSGSRYAGGLLASAWLVPIVATVVAVAEYIAPSSLPGGLRVLSDWPALAGAVIGVVSWLLIAVILGAMASAKSANGGSYGQLRERLTQLNADVHAVPAASQNGPAFATARDHRDFLTSELRSAGPRWVLATGYINAWRRLHRAEEALIEIKPLPEIIADTIYDELRMADSTMENGKQLLADLDEAKKYLIAQEAGDPPPADGTVHNEAEARSVLRSVRFAVSDFRDQRWAGLVRARNLLVGIIILTELFAFTLLALAIIEKAPSTAIVASIVFFLVGAVVGLFNRLSQQASAGTMVEDYGLGSVRAILTPIVSGLAAVGGVLLTAMVTMSGLTGLVQPGKTGTGPPVALPALADVFDLNTFRIGLLIAVLFGWAPALLGARLQALTDEYKEDLKSTETSGAAPAPAKGA